MLSLLAALWTGASPVLLQDTAPGAAVDGETYLEVDTGADPNVLVVKNDHWGAELFTVLDGRRTLVIDLCPGPCSGNPEQLTRVGGKLLFLGSDRGEEFPTQLWATDGTQVAKLADGVANSAARPARLTLVGDQLLFQKGADVWVSDGNGAAALSWGKGRDLSSAQATPANRFVALNSATACELFGSGTDVRQATALPMPATAERCAEPLATLGDRAFLSLASGLWRFDAAPSPAVRIDEPGSFLTRVGAGLFFFRAAPMSLALFRSTGEPNGTVPLGMIVSDGVRQTAATGGRLLYAAGGPGGVTRLYSSDGTTAGTLELPLAATATHAILPVGPVAYVVAETSGAGTARTELIETDGTRSGTVVLQGVRPLHRLAQAGHHEARPHAIALAMIGTVVADFGAFRVRPGEDPEAVFLKPANPKNAALSAPLVAGAQAFFTAEERVFRTDGTPSGTFHFADGGLVGLVGDRVLVATADLLTSLALDGGEAISLGPGPVRFPAAVSLGKTALLATGKDPRTLWRTDGTTTVLLAELGDGGFPAPEQQGNGRGVFPVGNTVWFSDGTVAGTRGVPVPDLARIAAGWSAVWTVSTKTFPPSTVLSRVSADGAVAVQVWQAGETLDALTPADETLYFLVHAPGRAEVWRANGATAAPVATLVTARALAVYRGRLMVLGDRGEGQQLLELGASGLTERFGAPGATFLHVTNDTLFADLATANSGLELYHLQEGIGLAAPLMVGADLVPGPGSSNPSPPTALGGKFLFTAWTPEAGREPWSWTPDPPPAAPPRGCGCGTGGAPLLTLLVLWLGWLAGQRVKTRLQQVTAPSAFCSSLTSTRRSETPRHSSAAAVAGKLAG